MNIHRLIEPCMLIPSSSTMQSLCPLYFVVFLYSHNITCALKLTTIVNNVIDGMGKQ